jgi:uncharacterized protein
MTDTRGRPGGPPLPDLRGLLWGPETGHVVLDQARCVFRARLRTGEPAVAYYLDAPDPDSALPPPDAPPPPRRPADMARPARSAGAPVAFRQFVLKVHSRCNLRCRYCYIYQGPDSSWRDRPVGVPDVVVRDTARRVAEHAAAHRLATVRLDLHGGEPLLRGAGPVVAYAEAVRRAVRSATDGRCRIAVTVQTNGTLLTEQVLDRLAEARIAVGLSLDGGTAAHNRRRVDHGDRPAWPAAARAARLLAARPGQYAGVLCTIDPAAEPEDVFRSLLSLGPPALDLLLPHAHWGARPPEAGVSYGDWLARVFDQWWAQRPDGRRAGPVRVRLFTEILALLLGVPSATESVGLSPLAAVVVDTDGAIEQVDALKSAYSGAPGTGLDVRQHSFDQALVHPGIAARQAGRWALAAACRRCPVGRVCGGGNYVHRYTPGAGFRHPSVYCSDLEQLIRHVARRLALVEGSPGSALTRSRGVG